jgi:hypothetical protein
MVGGRVKGKAQQSRPLPPTAAERLQWMPDLTTRSRGNDRDPEGAETPDSGSGRRTAGD